MFWIPLCIVVGMLYYIYAYVDAVKTGAYQRKANKLNKISSDFISRVSDEAFEERLREKYDGKYSRCFDTICDFVGCKPETQDKYPLINHWEIMARAAEMSKHGKLPRMMLFGALNNMIFKDRVVLAWYEKYLLSLEDALCKADVKTLMVCECRTQDSNGVTSCTPVGLRDYVARYGYGKTKVSDPIKFVQLSSHCLAFREFS